MISWNRAAEELIGRTACEMIGQPIQQAVPADQRKLFDRLLRRTAKGGKDTQFDVRLTAGGQERDLIVILSPIPGQDALNRGVAAWVVDETDRKRLSERLAQAEKMASLGTLAGGVAHHFNNILGGVATFVDFALTSGDPAVMRRALQMTAEAASGRARSRRSLLSFAEQDTHRTDLADLTEVVLTFAHLVERPLAERNIGSSWTCGRCRIVRRRGQPDAPGPGQPADQRRRGHARRRADPHRPRLRRGARRC